MILRTLLLVVAGALGAQLINARTAHPRTVCEYYLLLPDKYFEANQEQRVKRMLDPKRGAVVDLKNGYFAQGDGAQMSIVVRLFKNHDRTYTIGVDATYWEGADYARLSFYRYVNGNLMDVTKSIVPVALPEEHRYELPRYGKTIKVATQKRRHLYNLVWNGRRFLKRAR